MEIIDPLFEGNEIKAVKSLWDDPDCRREIVREEGKRILKEDKPIFSHPQEQIMAMVYQANFDCSEEECVVVAGMLIRNMRSDNIFPSLEELFTDFVFHPEISNYTSMNFASKCLISTSLFYKNMERMHKKYSAPHPNYYISVGKRALEVIDRTDVSRHFDNWRSHISEFFCV